MVVAVVLAHALQLVHRQTPVETPPVHDVVTISEYFLKHAVWAKPAHLPSAISYPLNYRGPGDLGPAPRLGWG